MPPPSPIGNHLAQITTLLSSINIGVGLANQKLGVIAANSAPPPAKPPTPPQGSGWFGQTVAGATRAASSLVGNRYVQPLTSALKKAPKVTKFIGKAAGTVVGGAMGGPAGAAVGGAIGGAIGDLAGKFAGGVGVMIGAVTELTNAFNQRAKELMPFSPQIAVANAQNNLKTMLADMREADAMGDSYANIMSSSNDIWLEIRDILLPIKKVIADTLGGFLEFVRDFIQWVRPLLKAIATGISGTFSAMTKLATFRFQGAIEELEKTMKGIEKALTEKEKAKDSNDLWKQLEANIPRLPDVGIGPNAAGFGLRAPALQL